MRQGREGSMTSRRDALRLIGASGAALLLPHAASVAAARVASVTLTARPATAPLGAGEFPDSRVWAYDGRVPGPVLRTRQGEPFRARLRNGLTQPTTIHWHGIRIDNAMDGVAGLTQPAVPPGEAFDYEFTPPDAGTFWYHPHHRSWEQLARGLYGVLIVEEPNPPRVDRDLVLVFDDWRLNAGGQIDEASFGRLMDWSHSGRLGNWLTVNGRPRPTFAVATGERLRLRLINTANARILSLRMPGQDARIIALDGQPVAPHRPRNGVIVLAPGMRADVVVDMGEDPGAEAAIDLVSQQGSLGVVRFVYDPKRVMRESPLDAPIRLPANPLPVRLDLADALGADLIMEGGAMGGMTGAVMGGRYLGMRDLVGQGMAWAFNGVAGMPVKPLIDVPRGRTTVLRMINRTAWPHAIHLHGQHFRAVRRNGRPLADAPWRDTVLVERSETVDVAFVADNPGNWLLHCHMLEHQAAGMVTWLRVVG